MTISAIVFVAYWAPNSTGAKDHPMIQVFEPDEAAQASVIDRMTSPKPSIQVFLQYFITYDYYHYGFPFFGLSSLPVFLLRWLNQYDNTPLVMATLRQFLSVLPTMIALLLLTYMADGFKTYKSLVIYLLLLSIPAVISNNLWWHPDGLTILFSVLTLFFLWKDGGRLERYFYYAAIFSGILTATKLIGVYFYIPAIVLIVTKIKQNGLTIKDGSKKLLSFILISFLAFCISNPFLFDPGSLLKYLYTIYRQISVVSNGYGVIYQTGLKAVWPNLVSYFGYWFFLLIAFISMVYGLSKPEKRHLHLVILSWVLPLSLTTIFTAHFKFQYWLPAALPMISCIGNLLPDKKSWQDKNYFLIVCNLLVVPTLVFQGYSNGKNAYARLNEQLVREQTNPRIRFYYEAREMLRPLDNLEPHIYYDYRFYMPYMNPWSFETSYDLLDYDYIDKGGFDVLLLLQQRLSDYTNPNVQGIDEEDFPKNQLFYNDANTGSVTGYKLLYRNETGLIYINQNLCDYFPEGSCN